MTYSSLVDWFESRGFSPSDWGDFSNEDVQRILLDTLESYTDNAGVIYGAEQAIQHDEFVDKFDRTFESEMMSAVNDLDSSENIYRNRESVARNHRGQIESILRTEIRDFETAQNIRDNYPTLARNFSRIIEAETRKEVRGRGGEGLLRSLSDEELLDDLKSVQQKHGSGFFLSNQQLTEEVFRRGLV